MNPCDEDMRSLYEETIRSLSMDGYSWEDVDWVGSREFEIPKEDFINLAKKTFYDSGFGWQQVAKDLVIVMKDSSWYSRYEYDGSERWTHNKVISKPDKTIDNLYRLCSTVGWETLKEMNSYEEEENNGCVEFDD